LHSGEASPIERALDLVLNEIVQQARLATNATGAAIALAKGGALICRATSGVTAPEVAALLNARSGLAGTCLRTGRLQRCDDAESDPQVNGVACRRQGARSIIIVPVHDKDEGPLGVIEIFAPRPNAFGDRDVLLLEAFSRRVLANIDLARQVMTSAPASAPAKPVTEQPQPTPAAPRKEIHLPQLKFHSPEVSFHVPQVKFRQTELNVPRLKFHLPQIKFHIHHFHFPVPKLQFHVPGLKLHVRQAEFHLPRLRFHLPRFKFHPFHVPLPVPGFGSGSSGGRSGTWTRDGMLTLTALIITLALLVGWMIGWRAGRERTPVSNRVKSEVPAATVSHENPSQAATPVTSVPVATENPSAATPKPGLSNAVSTTDALRPKTTGENARPVTPIQLSASKVKVTKSSITDETPTGGLVVYEKGKVIFRLKPSKQPPEPAKDPTAEK
jgi:putative methionine-R-sulfoxide reductase with GAF domain